MTTGAAKTATTARRWPAWRLPGRAWLVRPGEDARAWFHRQFEREASARSAFHLVPLGLAAGAALVYGAGWRPGLAAVSLAALLFLCLSALCRPRPAFANGLLAAGFCLAGGALATQELARAATTIFSGEATVRIEGRVLWRDRDEGNRFRYLIAIERTERPVLSRPPETARVVVSSRHAPLDPGATYAGLVRLRAPAGPAYPGAHDFAFAPFFGGPGAYGFSLGAPEPREARPPAGLSDRIWFALATIRIAMTQRIAETIGGPSGAIAAALVTGERAGIPEEVEEWLRGTGLAHVLSISGLHMALVAGFAMTLTRALLGLSTALALRWPLKKIAALVALGIATFYLLISGGNVATTRSYVMLAVMLTAVLFDRPAVTLRNLSIGAIVVLLYQPHSVMTASFQMSFAATAALVGLYTALARSLAERRRRRGEEKAGRLRHGWRVVAGAAFASLLAAAATGPYGAYHFQTLNPYGFVANVLTMPLFGLWIMPLALLSAVAMPFGLDGPLLVLMGWGLDGVLLVAEGLYPWLPSTPVGLTSAAGLLLLTAAILAASLLVSGLRWIALPLALAGLAVAPQGGVRPSLLIFEDGKEIAVLQADGALAYLKPRPSRFVADQWQRAYGGGMMARGGPLRTIERDDCAGGICRFATQDGLRIAWTDEFEGWSRACDGSDVAIVARALRPARCPSGALLVTLRTLRRTGSLAISRDAETGRVTTESSIGVEPNEWNRHRLARWPEFWRKPVDDASAAKDAPRATSPGEASAAAPDETRP
ncbi:ComEC/Rec2 family competence protein [Aurantimonas sp. Leaf443]|uniref:ComEC/Rec2 family competence protein n=1 Tax=Aurantimonas sp. Leaf443 TaxID=1736378 RepID=UPI0006FE5BCE|nr:ComEC/Rec2 family competence protein [Aurantimonas sp. Leaf443]KQT83450.1 hypothetical protein ASG48_12900 [Aurantimonas sp. Leaf443]